MDDIEKSRLVGEEMLRLQEHMKKNSISPEIGCLAMIMMIVDQVKFNNNDKENFLRTMGDTWDLL
jgi:hypothetical protein